MDDLTEISANIEPEWNSVFRAQLIEKPHGESSWQSNIRVVDFGLCK